MLMKIDQTMESGGGESSGESRESLSPMVLPLSRGGSKTPYSPPMDRNSPLGPPTSLSAHHMINSIAASSAKNMTPGLLASLSALNAMGSAAAAASFHHHDFSGSNSSYERGLDRHPYGSPPAPVAPSNDPSANECKLVDYRGQKVAAFVINGDTMLCLPQAFELFLKHLVGGLHTVYTKLKRLDIIPIVCNVEQVRILRGLGAIQPGVNRCKLLSCKDFDVLYKDCTTARPGRPPKRTSVPLVPLSQHGSHYMSMKKHRLENGDYAPYETHHNPADIMRLEKSPLLANGYNHPPTQIPPMHLLPLAGQSAAAAAVAAHSALFSPSGLPLPPGHPRDCRSAPLQSLDAVARNATWETCRSAYEDFVKQFESRYNHEDCSDSEKSSHANEAGSGEGFIRNGNLEPSSPVLNLSKNIVNPPSDDSDDNAGDDEDDFSDNERSTNRYVSGVRSKSAQIEDRKNSAEENPSQNRIESPPSQFAEVSATEAAISSTENLLRNIQGLLKVAADNAKQQERRINLEKAEFKMEILREREIREQLEKQLVEERNLRIYYEKRWKKERRSRKNMHCRSSDNQDDSSESPHHHSNHSHHHHFNDRSSPQNQSQQYNNNDKNCTSENAKSHQNQSTPVPSTNGNSVKGDSGNDR